MKIKVLLFLFFAASLSVVLSSYRDGPMKHSGWDGTGAGTNTGCANGGGCHVSTSSLSPTVELDSAGVAVTSYQPGGSYTVKISATNATTGTFGYFGFQLATVSATGAGSASATQAGTWGTSLPPNVQNTPGSGRTAFPIIEHSSAIQATSGTGGAGTVYSESIPWTAPAAGSGSIEICGVMNAVTGLDIAFLCDYQTAPPVTIAEAVATGINTLSDKLSCLKVYPILMNDNITVAFDLKETSAISVSLISMEGQTVKTFMSQESLGQGSFKRSFDVSGLATGVYLMRLQIGNESVVTKVVKE
jgi:hypothetical protein